MKVKKFETREAWLEGRLGKITGSRVLKLIPKKKKGRTADFYRLIAERVATPPEEEISDLEWGNLNEAAAIQRFEEETGKKVNTDLVIWSRDDNENIAISPDGSIGETEAIETKCLSTPNHIKAWFNGIPSAYSEQLIQYFVVNESLDTLYFAFYDPRMSVNDFFYKTIKREDIQDQIDKYLEAQRCILEEVTDIITQWTF